MQTLQVGEYTSSYQKIGKGPLLVLLHGWANNWETWLTIVPTLADHFTLIIPDLPGFGASEGPKEGWSTRDYCLWLQGFLKEILKLYPSNLLYLAGHSFGGKIAALYTSQVFSPSADRLILLDASGIPPKLNKKQRVLRLMALATPPFLKSTVSWALRSKIYKAFDANSDYLNANADLRKTLKKILPENLSSELMEIKIPTLIIWGRNDPATPISAGHEFHQLITDSQLKVFDAEHFPHHQHPESVAATMTEFLKSKAKPVNQDQSASTVANKQSLTTQLAILQQAEYEWPRFLDWLQHQETQMGVEPKKWTAKLKTLRFLIMVTAPFLGELRAIFLWNTLLKLPQHLYFSLVIKLAKMKLKFLQKRGLIVIAIAGSYAKTSTKYIMQHVFSTSLTTLMTPENINTPYGIARVILGDLKSNTEVFIAELGEYYPGDIAQLTNFLNPKYKVLTPIGHAHLERFRTEGRLERGLLELLTTGESQASFVNQDNKRLLTKHGVKTPAVYYGLASIKEVHVTRAGTEFTNEGESIFIPLLGRHNAINVLPTLLLAKELFLDRTVIVGRLRTLPHIPHRLEPTLLEHNVLLLDNGYNSNPASARESLAVLGEIEGSQKIAITPGFVEMGTEQEAANVRFGEEMAKVCDFVGVVSGANEAALLTGLTQAEFDKAHIITGATELEVMQNLQTHIKPNAVILFENSILELYKQ